MIMQLEIGRDGAAERHTNRAGKEKRQMIPLLKLAIEAHGGLERWREVHGIDLKLTIGGGLWQLKGLPQGLVDVALHVEPAHRLVTITPFGPEGAAGYFTPHRVWIQKPQGDVVQERSAPRRSFDGHTLTTPWDKLHELYFVSYAFLNYLSTPFLFAEPGFEVAEGNPYFGAGEKWRRLHVKYPAAYPTHSREQTLYFNEKGLLQRLDYVAEVVQAGTSHFCLKYETVGGIVFPTHRRVLGRDPKQEEPDRSAPPAVEVRISDIQIRPKGSRT
jgi:hypothetical protein